MTKKIYPEIVTSPNFAAIEEKILAFWQQHAIFKRSVELHPKQHEHAHPTEFVFYDGPPFANGLPHYGHILTGNIKDTYGRYQTQKGKRVERRFGWDCHGLPAEMQVEKELSLAGRGGIINYGIAKFNEQCRQSVMKYAAEWEQYVVRQGRWVDFTNSYKTMDLSFMESVIWVFQQLYKKGYIYQSMKVMPYSWACETPLSNFETRLDNAYRERTDKAVTVSFQLKNKPKFITEDCQSYHIIAWTTTPWTLPSNLALAVNPEIEYIAVQKEQKCYILGAFAAEQYKDLLKDAQIIARFKGQDLAGLQYEPLFAYFKNHPHAFTILAAEFVVEGSGSGIVHIAPGFGEDDYLLCQAHNIELVCPVDSKGCFTEPVSDLVGIQVFEANNQIIQRLKAQGSWLKTEQYTHNYPHCWRTDTPLIYKAVSSWYVKVSAFKDRMVELNQQINWIPHNIKNGLFGNWLENARDWAISRNRFWGTPIPIWQSDNPQYPRIDVYGSIAEIEADFQVKITDLHRPLIDELVRPNPDDPTGQSMMRRVPEVFDCWFESGSMPYGQVHYPFENKDWFEAHFPADFIVEYTAQTRGWFYTLMVLSTALFDKPPFLNCICHGVVLDSSGQKLSKRLNNYPDPLELFKQYGADALRFTMLASGITKGQELLFDKEGVMVFDTLRLVIKPIWNAYHFFTIYANADAMQGHIITEGKHLDISDRYILAKLRIAIISIDQALTSFDSQAACQQLQNFFEVLTNWYIRSNRERFWRSEKDQNKQNAYDTLYTCLVLICRSVASLLPLITEEVYLGLHNNDYDGELSVHLTAYPLAEAHNLPDDAVLTSNMDTILEIYNCALSIRSAQNIRVRQPLAKLTIVLHSSYMAEHGRALQAYSKLLEDEVNVKAVIFTQDDGEYTLPSLTLNFAAIGKRLPTKVKDIIAASKSSQWQLVDNKLLIASCELEEHEFTLNITTKEGIIAKDLPSKKGLVFLDLDITQTLHLEGLGRDLIRTIQQARKDAALNITDRIELDIDTSGDLLLASQDFQTLIEGQCLAKYAKLTNHIHISETEINGQKVIIRLQHL